MTPDLSYSWKRLQEVKLMHRSVSQVSEYLESLGGCNYKYFLKRVVRVWDKPAAWFPQGSGVHTGAEFWEKNGRKPSRETVQAVYREEYTREVYRYAEKTPNLNYWSPSHIYVGWDDITRRALVGVKQLDNYLDYYEKNPDQVPWTTQDGQKAIELKFEVALDGVKAMGFIDQVIVRPDGTTVVRDLKTGKKPGGMLQLKTYQIALVEQFDLLVDSGDYFLLDKKKPLAPYDLDAMSEDQVTDLFGLMDRGVREESFDPSPEPEKCRMCTFKTSCEYSAEGK